MSRPNLSLAALGVSALALSTGCHTQTRFPAPWLRVVEVHSFQLMAESGQSYRSLVERKAGARWREVADVRGFVDVVARGDHAIVPTSHRTLAFVEKGRGITGEAACSGTSFVSPDFAELVVFDDPAAEGSPASRELRAHVYSGEGAHLRETRYLFAAPPEGFRTTRSSAYDFAGFLAGNDLLLAQDLEAQSGDTGQGA